MKYGFIKYNEYYIPQYKKEDNEEFKNFIYGNIKGTELEDFASSIGVAGRFSGNAFHFSPSKGQDIKDMSLFFISELKVWAFLGAAKYFFENRKTIEISL